MLIGLAVGWACLLNTIALALRWRGQPRVSDREVTFVLTVCWAIWLPVQIGWTLYAGWRWLGP